MSHSYFLSSDISTTSSSLLLSSACSLSFPYMNTFFPDILFPSHLFSLPLLTLSSSTTTWLNSEGKVDSGWFLKSDLVYCLSSASLLWQLMFRDTQGKGELLFCEIWLDRVTPHSHLLSNASFPTIDIFALWLHWEYINKVSKSSIWYSKKAYIGWAFHIISANLPFPYFYSLQFNYKSVYCYHHHTALFECVSLSFPG